MLAVGSLLIAGVATGGAYADVTPSAQSVVVTDGSDWYTQAYESIDKGEYTDPQQSDVTGPQRAPFGAGSHKMTIGQYAAQTELYRTDKYDGVKLADLTRLEYSTFARNTTAGGADRQPAYLRLTVDSDGNGSADASLFYVPADNGTVVNGEWQNWNVTAGLLNTGDDAGTGDISLKAYAASHPGAKLVNNRFDETHDGGSISLIVGAANTQTRGEYFVDRVIVGENDQDTLFDFGATDETDGDTTDLTVDPGHAQGWKHQAYDDVNYLNSNQQFVAGPGTPPLGGGSLKMSLSDADNGGRVELFRTEQYDGTLVRDLRNITYSTFQRANAGNDTPQQPAYLRLSVDNDGNGSTDDTLFFYPGNSAQAPAQSTWQTWDAGQGDWTADGHPFDEFTLEQYTVAHPDATIVKNEDSSDVSQVDGGVAFIVGGGGDNQMNGEYFLDDINISKVDAATGSVNSGTEFDLEPTAPAVSVGDASVSEGNHGATLTFPVTVSKPTAEDVVVHYATSNGTAKAGSDYEATSGDLTIPANQTSGVVTVPVLSDKLREANETLTVTLTPAGYGSVAEGTATGTIVNDDTWVGLTLNRATTHRVRVNVNTLPDAPGATVKFYQVVNGHSKLVLSDELNNNGRITRVLATQYQPGTKVTIVAKVITENGLYSSNPKSITVG
jgi:Calx-beta domain